jgi:hypothetical protein
MRTKQQTAVEEFIDQLELKGNAWENASIKRIQISIDVSEYLELKKQAKEMEKERIETAYNKGTVHGIDYPESTLPITGEQYYNETYGGGEQ